MRTKHHHQATVTTAENIVDTHHQQRNILCRESPGVQYGRYQQREQQQRSSKLYEIAPRASTVVKGAATGLAEQLIPPLLAMFIGCMKIATGLFFIIALAVISVLLYFGIFWK
ncbi:unnamed protein product, partial [Rotaria sp. Silwood1]